MMPSFQIMGELERRCRPLLGTFVEITAPHEKAIAAGFATIVKVQSLLSAHDPVSELSAVNRLGHRRSVTVDPWTAEVLQRALFWAEASCGAFDPTLGGLMAARGLLARNDSLLPLDPQANWRDVHLTNREVWLDRPLRLDLGGIAKGFAVDCAIDAMRAVGIQCGLVNAGGDIKGFGPEAWPVTIAMPGSREPLAMVELQNAALATSAGHDASGGLDMRHLAGASPAIASVTVEAASAMDADALTKILVSATLKSAVCLGLAGASALTIFVDGRVIPFELKEPTA